jgi:hypothetical protein
MAALLLSFLKGFRELLTLVQKVRKSYLYLKCPASLEAIVIETVELYLVITDFLAIFWV